MTLVRNVISAARTVRSEHEIHPAAQLDVSIRGPEAVLTDAERHGGAIAALVKTTGERFESPDAQRAAGTVVAVIPTELGTVEALVSLKGHVTKEQELSRIERELKRIDKDIAALAKKLSSAGFVDRAPAEVVVEARAQLRSFEEAKERLVSARALADELS